MEQKIQGNHIINQFIQKYLNNLQKDSLKIRNIKV